VTLFFQNLETAILLNKIDSYFESVTIEKAKTACNAGLFHVIFELIIKTT